MRHAPVRLHCVIPRLAALLCSAAVLACSSEDALPTSATPAPLDARPAAALAFGPATPVPVPADCPETVPAHVNARGVIVGFTGGPCFGDSGSSSFLGDSDVIAAVIATGDEACRASERDYRVDTAPARQFLASQGVPLP